MDFLIKVIFPLRSESANIFFLWFTRIGDWQVILSLAIIACIFFWFYRKRNYILPLLTTFFGSLITVAGLKLFVDKPRPEATLALYAEHGSSFPSAHSALSLAFFGFLIGVILKSNLGRTVKTILSTGLVIVILLIGFSRLYLGVHFLSDVIAGYAIGLLWLLAVWYFFRKNIFS